jgi:hypothetical protein
MRFQIVTLGVLLGMSALGADNPVQSPTASKPVAAAPQSLTGCVDEQFGQYVLLDSQMVKIVNLQSAGSNNDVFAKYVGHEVQVKGTKSAGPKATFTVKGIEQIAETCGQAKEAK